MFLSGIALMVVRQWRIIEARGADRNFNLYEARSRLCSAMKITGRFSLGWQRIQVSALSSRAGSGIRIFAEGLVRAASVGLPRHLLLPQNVSADLTPKPVGAARQGSQGGVQG